MHFAKIYRPRVFALFSLLCSLRSIYNEIFRRTIETNSAAIYIIYWWFHLAGSRKSAALSPINSGSRARARITIYFSPPLNPPRCARWRVISTKKKKKKKKKGKCKNKNSELFVVVDDRRNFATTVISTHGKVHIAFKRMSLASNACVSYKYILYIYHIYSKRFMSIY